MTEKAFPTGRTRLFPVVGDPIAQVRSPAVISRLLHAGGHDALVVPMHIAPAQLARLFQALLNVGNVGGLLVTVPHKKAALGLCAAATERSRFLGAVNVVRRTRDGWYGDHTDGAGYLDGLEGEGFAAAGRTALLAGCGGAGSAIGLEFLRRGGAKLALHDVDGAKRDALAAKLAGRFPGRVVVGGTDPSGFDLVANATPMGMRPGDPFPVDADKLQAGQFVACVITEPAVSALIEQARQRGCRTMTGAGMFDAQAQPLADFLLVGDCGKVSPWKGISEPVS